MNFHARQYGPQLGRFLGVDPLADYYGQDRYSPYAAMGNQPESMIDPNGLAFHTVTAVAGIEIGGYSEETIASLKRMEMMSREGFEDHESYSMYQNLGLGGPGGSEEAGLHTEKQKALTLARTIVNLFGLFGNTETSSPNIGEAVIEVEEFNLQYHTLYEVDKDSDVIEYHENVLKQTKNTGIINGLDKLTTVGQLKSLIFEGLEERAKISGIYISLDEKTQIVSDLDKAFTRLGITISTALPEVKIAAGIISMGYKMENLKLWFKNEYIIKPRIESKFPGYFDPSSGFNRNRTGGGGAGGGW